MKKFIITAGGTSERIDNVRKITNSSSGKLGCVIANTILENISDSIIYYICSKNSIKPCDSRVKIIEIDGVVDLKNKVESLLKSDNIDFFVHSMAVSDYMTDYVTTINNIINCLKNGKSFNEVEKISDSKISSNEDNLVVVLKQTPKVISIIKDISPKTFLVGFKLLDGVCDEKLIYVGKNLMEKNQCDMVVANDLSNIRLGKHKAFLLDKDNMIEKASCKEDIAKKLVRRFKNG